MLLSSSRTLLKKKSPAKTPTAKEPDLRGQFVGLKARVPVLDGRQLTYVNFDNAASTPVLKPVLEKINEFMPWYSSVHRGTGFKSLLATEAYEEARQIVGQFFGANAKEHVVIFSKNTTESINKLSYRLQLKPDDIVLVSLMEHHSNDLPWRAQSQVKHIKTDEYGQLDEQHLDDLLDKYKKRVKLIAISGGSNVTGNINRIYEIAKKAHSIGAQIFVDCAQLAPHRQVDIGSLKDPAHLDYIAISAHKMYAPFGAGALIGRRDTFEKGEPEMRGGGTISVVTTEDVEWACPPDREEAGSPNVVGAVALAASLKFLDKIGMPAVAAHEARLTTYLLEKLNKIPRVKIYGDINPRNSSDRLGVVPFNMDNLPAPLTAAILGTEWGIGVRNGCFCAHPYVTHLLDLNETELKKFKTEVLNDDRRHMPGLVRVSFGLYNTEAEIDRLAEALKAISAGNYKGKYKQDKLSGEFTAEGWQPDLESHFSLS